MKHSRRSTAQVFEDKLRLSGLIRPGERVLIACSGGPDSTALFHLLHGLSRSWKLKLALIHVNHGLRGRNSLRDEKFVRALAARAQVPFTGVRVRVQDLARRKKWSVEEAAREARYQAIERTAARRRMMKVAFAHTQDDQAETVLMRMLQGTGSRGLLAIRVSRPLGKSTLVRPLLGFRKKEILAWLKDQRYSFVKDETNKTPRFFRNRIRRKLMPLLKKEFNPKIVEALSRIPAALEDDFQVLAAAEAEAWKRLHPVWKDGAIQFSRRRYEACERAVRFRLLERALKALDPAGGLSSENWNGLRACFLRPRGRWSLQRDIDLEVTPSRILLYKKRAAA